MPRTGRNRFWQYLWEQKRWFWLGSVSAVIMNTAVVLPPLMLGRAVDAAGGYRAPGGPAQLTRALWLFVGALLLYNVPRVGKRYWLRVMANRMNCRLRTDILQAVFRYPLPRFEQEHIGDIMSRAIGDVQVFADAVQFAVTEVYDTALMMLSHFVALLSMRPQLTLIATLPVPASLALAQVLGSRVFARSLRVRQESSSLTQLLQQAVSGVRVLRLLGRDQAEASRLADASWRLKEAGIALELLQSGLMPIYSAIAAAGVVLVIGVGGNAVAAGDWTIGAFLAYLTMFINMAFRMLVAARVINRSYAGAAAWTRIEAKLAAVEQEAASPETGLVKALGPRLAQAALKATGLTMAFPGTGAALAGIDLEIPAGAWVGVTGPVGSGKSALALVMSGLYPYQGSLTVNGRELSDFAASEKVANIGYLGQDAFLFSASIKDNICLDRAGAPDMAVFADVAEWAAVRDDLPLFAQGYATPVGEAGVRVSGGQRQRIALARALFARAPLLILDDPFSAVDLATERQLILRLRDAFRGTTVVMMSHRLASFAHTDQVVVLDKGKIIQQGTHAELLAADGLYSRIFRAQQWLEGRAL
jgi:ABC-type multidrug transport system fused ATPase/permease subunit